MKYLKNVLHKMNKDECIDWLLKLKIQKTLKGLNSQRQKILTAVEDKLWEEHRL